MTLPEISVQRPITIVMLFLGIFIIGVVTMVRLPIDLFPDITPPSVSVLTDYPGSNAEDVEINVTKVIESGLSVVSDLKKMTSSSTDGVSVITLEFNSGTNMDEAANNIRDALEFVKPNLPDGAQSPIIFKFSTTFFPIMFLGITADKSYPELNQLIETNVTDPLKRLPGVGTVFAYGGPVREIRIGLDPDRLRAYHLSQAQIAQTLSTSNVTLPAGDIKMGQMDYNIRVPAEFTNVDQIKNVPVGNFQGRLVYLKDVAMVRDTLKQQTIRVLLNGQHGMQLAVQKQSGANTVTVARAVRAWLQELEQNLPPDVKVDIVMDSSEFILHSIRGLVEAVLLGGIFVALIILAFLRQWRGTVILLLTIPFSLIAAFIYLYFTNNSINIISLSSLSIAIGMVVDDAIVILENISTHVERGARPAEAAVTGSSEVGLAVMASTLTIVAVFFPLVFLTGTAGIMFRMLGFLVPITILMSLLAALSLIPMLSSRLLRPAAAGDAVRSPFRRVSELFERGLHRLDDLYESAVTWSLHHRKTVVLSAAGLLVVSLLLVPRIGTEFLPQSDSGQLQITGQLDTGTRLEETTAVAEHIQQILQQHFPQIRYVLMRAGVNQQGFSSALFGQQEGSYIFNIQLQLTPKTQRKKSVFVLADEMRKMIRQVPGIVQLHVSTGGAGAALFGGTGSPVEIDILGNDFNVTGGLAAAVADSLRGISGARNVRVSRGPDRPELRVELDRDRLAYAGLNAAQVARSLRNNLYGAVASQYREQGHEYDIFLRYPPEDRTSIAQVENIPLTASGGNIINVKDLGTVEESYAPPEVDRLNQERVVTVTAGVSGSSLGQVTSAIQKKLRAMDVPEGVRIQYGGQIEQQRSSFGNLFFFLLLSIVLVYMVMASQFESLLDPFVIMFSVPFAFVGVIWALFVTGLTLSVVAFLGAIILVGIVVKNAIVLVDYINLTRQRGRELQDAIVYSGRNRLRPVLMTALTTLLGMLPLALSRGEGSEIWVPLGVTVIGGLLVSTLVTLIIVPVMYAVFDKRVKLSFGSSVTGTSAPGTGVTPAEDH